MGTKRRYESSGLSLHRVQRRQTVADEELRRRIVEFSVRKTARVTNTDSKTIMLISKGERVKPRTLARVSEFFMVYRVGQAIAGYFEFG
jgi:hypothetical protein